ncbi:Barrierpepsin [Drechslerella dactyloides]|uniref:Barrierpepsin n=1 Tax=Drechslerella dactyloides TaxID=74499 RepID=A0AAD6J106_DREDA|nr:Barrierpepsin [Drechslerella dactyloides]
MKIWMALSAALVCLATAEGLKLQLHSSLGQPPEAVKDLAKRASSISATFQFAAPQFSYYVDILVGSAHEFIRLRLSSDPLTWLPGPLPKKNYCNGSTQANFDLCVRANFSGVFDPVSSRTFKNLTTTLNLTSSDTRYYALGYYGQDTLQIGQRAIANVPIGIANQYTLTPQLGLGIGGTGSEMTLLRTMLNENIISVLSYGIYLNDYDFNRSELTIGAIDIAKYDGPLITLESDGTTVVQLDNLQYNDATGGSPEVLAKSWNANVEFSTGLLYFPNGPLQAIIGDFDAYFDTTYGGYLTDCSYRWSNKSLIFNFASTTITVPASQWIVPAYTVAGYQVTLRDGSTPACIVLVDSIDNYVLAAKTGFVAVFGMPFVRAIYLVLDFTNQQISFAQAKLNVSESELRSLGHDGLAPFATAIPSNTPANTQTGSAIGGPGGRTPTGFPKWAPGILVPFAFMCGGVIFVMFDP